MINREDMLELTRRMTPARSSVARIAGAYLDEEGYIDGTFNTNFLKLSAGERSKNLNLAKQVLLSKTNEQLQEHKISSAMRKPGSIWQLLDGMLESELKNDAFPDLLYELIGEVFRSGYPYACFLYFGQYDVPVKGTDRAWLEGSEEVYKYILCSVSPLAGEYEPGAPLFGFLYPAFRGRSTDRAYVNIFEAQEGAFNELKAWLLAGKNKRGDRH